MHRLNPPATIKNCQMFTGAIIETAKEPIPRTFSKEYIAGCDNACGEKYKLFLKYKSIKSFLKYKSNKSFLQKCVSRMRQERWKETVSNLYFKKSSKKAWSILRKLGEGPKKTIQKCTYCT